jgi:hypothetical protein
MSGFTVTRSQPELWNVTFDNPPADLVDPEMILELQRSSIRSSTIPRQLSWCSTVPTLTTSAGRTTCPERRTRQEPRSPFPCQPAVSGGLARRTLWPPRMILSGSD